MIDPAAVKACARECGAALVGIGSMDRFEGAPPEMDPRFVFPDARAMIALAFRIPRGYLRGIEEGIHFYQYPAMGYANINEVYAPCAVSTGPRPNRCSSFRRSSAATTPTSAATTTRCAVDEEASAPA